MVRMVAVVGAVVGSRGVVASAVVGGDELGDGDGNGVECCYLFRSWFEVERPPCVTPAIQRVTWPISPYD